MRYCMYCGMPMEDDDMFCTRCGKSTAKSSEKMAPKNAVDPGVMLEDATVTGTMRTMTTDTAFGGAAYNAGRGAAPAAPGSAGAENSAYGSPAPNGALYKGGAAAAGGAAYGSGRAASNGAAYGAGAGAPNGASNGAAYGAGAGASRGVSPGPGRRSGGSGKSGPGKDSMYGNPHVDSAIEKSRRRGKTDPGRYIMLASAAVLVLVLGFLLFLLVKPADTEEDKNDTETVAYEDNSQKDENLDQGQQTPASGQAESSDDSSDFDYQGIPSPAQGGDDSGSGQQAQDSGQQAQDSGQQAQDSGQQAQDSGQQAQDSGQQAQDSGQQAQDSGQQAQDSGQQAQDSGQQAQDSGQQAQDSGQSAAEQKAEDYDDSEDYDEGGDGSGWEVDEDGNEVYYAGADEENTDSDQTDIGGGDKKTESDDVTSQSADKDKKVADEFKTEDSDDYILPDSSTRYYTREELEKLNDYDLQMAINELYARHGRKFDTKSIREYFESKSWYRGTIDPADFDGNEAQYFNAYEMANRELMTQIRAERQAAAGQ